jgi:hypothetical protein
VLGLKPASLALTAVLVAYWIPALVNLRWGQWRGGDPIELALSLRDHYWIDLWTPAFAPYGVVVLPLVIGGTAASLWSLLRALRAGTPHDPTLVAAALLGLPHALVAIWAGVIYAILFVVCRSASCWNLI